MKVRKSVHLNRLEIRIQKVVSRDKMMSTENSDLQFSKRTILSRNKLDSYSFLYAKKLCVVESLFT